MTLKGIINSELSIRLFSSITLDNPTDESNQLYSKYKEIFPLDCELRDKYSIIPQVSPKLEVLTDDTVVVTSDDSNSAEREYQLSHKL